MKIMKKPRKNMLIKEQNKHHSSEKLGSRETLIIKKGKKKIN